MTANDVTANDATENNTPGDNGPKTNLKTLLSQHMRPKLGDIRSWVIAKSREAAPPFYCSIDLRDAGFKIAPVDSNLYPAGFNNICEIDRENAACIFKSEIKCLFKGQGLSEPEKILIIPESHTQNRYYAENLHHLAEILRNAGYDLEIGWYSPETFDRADAAPVELTSASGHKIAARPMRLDGAVLKAGSFVPDLVLLNNDFSSGYPEFLDRVQQPILPSHLLGWHTRSKGGHFKRYNRLAKEFAEMIGVDPWLITVESEIVESVNFNEGEGLDRVKASVERVLENTRREYKARGIRREPFVFVKNDAGTYGMGIMVVREAKELDELNRREKNKMSVGKGGLAIQDVLVQEGLPTVTRVKQAASEPVIYLAGTELVGGFLRTNQERTTEDNLNSRGMVFQTLCMSELKLMKTLNMEEPPLSDEHAADEPVLELVYGSIARISSLATGLEQTEEWLARQKGSDRPLMQKFDYQKSLPPCDRPGDRG